MSYSQVKMDDLPPSLIERQSLAQTDDTNDGRIHIAIHVDQTHQIFSEGDIVTGSATITADVDVYAPYIEVDFIGESIPTLHSPRDIDFTFKDMPRHAGKILSWVPASSKANTPF